MSKRKGLDDEDVVDDSYISNNDEMNNDDDATQIVIDDINTDFVEDVQRDSNLSNDVNMTEASSDHMEVATIVGNSSSSISSSFLDPQTVITIPAPTNTVTAKRSKSEIKKPITSWMIFANEHRERIAKENPALNFTDVAKQLGEQYRGISDEERTRLNGLAALDKERYNMEMKAYEASADGAEALKQGNLLPELVITSGRLKRIIKLDPEVKSIGKDATAALARATELFIQHLANRSLSVAKARGVRTIRDVDVVQTIHQHDALEFLRLDFPKRPAADMMQRQSSSSSHASSNKPRTTSSNAHAGKLASSSSASIGGKQAITSFFMQSKSDHKIIDEPNMVSTSSSDAVHEGDVIATMMSSHTIEVTAVDGHVDSKADVAVVHNDVMDN